MMDFMSAATTVIAGGITMLEVIHNSVVNYTADGKFLAIYNAADVMGRKTGNLKDIKEQAMADYQDEIKCLSMNKVEEITKNILNVYNGESKEEYINILSPYLDSSYLESTAKNIHEQAMGNIVVKILNGDYNTNNILSLN